MLSPTDWDVSRDRLLALLYGPAARCKPKVKDLEEIGLALLYPACNGTFVPGQYGYPRALDLIRVSAPKAIRAT